MMMRMCGKQWNVLAEYATGHRAAMDIVEIVDNILKSTYNLCTIAVCFWSSDLLEKSDDLYLWSLNSES